MSTQLHKLLKTEPELPDDLCPEFKRKLAMELCQRFPQRVEYRRVVEYADVDRFDPIQDGNNPPVSFDYRIKLQ